jgi:iron(III) transport system permease protein
VPSRIPGPRESGRGGSITAAVVLALGVLVVFPMAFVVLQAIFPSIGAGSFAAPFSLIPQTFGDPKLVRWTLNTLALGVCVVLASTAVALPLGALRGLFRVPLAGLWDVAFLVPFTIPPYIAALGWITTLQRNGYLEQLAGFNLGGFLFSFWGVVFVMTLNVFPVVYFGVSRSMASIGGRYVDAAQVCGAAFWPMFRRIAVPLATPAMAGSLLLVFAMSIEEFGTPAVLAARSGFLVLVTGVEQRLSDYPVDLPGAASLSLVLVVLAGIAFIAQQRMVTGRDFRTLTGRPASGGPRPLGRWAIPCSALFALLALAATIVPVAAVLLTASTRTLSGGLAWGNFSTLHFAEIRANANGALDALVTSFLLGIVTALLTGLIGTLAAFVLVRSRSRAGRLLDFLTVLPNTMPGVVIAVGLILAWTQPWLPLTAYNTVWILLLAYCCLLLPYPVRYATAALRQLGPSLEEAARVSGAAPARALARIVVPLILPAVTAAMLLVFAVAARELVATVLLAPVGTRTVALFIWRQFDQGSIGLGMAMSAIAIAITVTVPAIAMFWLRRTGQGL